MKVPHRKIKKRIEKVLMKKIRDANSIDHLDVAYLDTMRDVYPEWVAECQEILKQEYETLFHNTN